ncbi:MAG: hypothetical protein AAGC85_04610 [Bacteroidota bacterium]
MARINGANSDYKFDEGTGSVVENKSVSPLYMKIFICPYDQPSSLQAGGSAACEGSDDTCPNAITTGHASITLHQEEGIILLTDESTRIQIPQNGGAIDINGIQTERQSNGDQWVRLGANGPKIELLNNGSINLVPSGSGQVMIGGIPIPI